MTMEWIFITYGGVFTCEIIKVKSVPTEDKTALRRVIAGFIRDVKAKPAYAS